MVLPEVALDGADPAQAFVGARWHDILPRAVVCPALPAHVLLHAGPPLRSAPPAPVMNASIQALLFERLAEDEVQARRLLIAGDVVLEPAQNHGIVTPLAQVVSGSMLLVAVTHHAHTGYGALIEGGAPALRFGSNTPACRERLAVLNEQLLQYVAPCVRRAPIALDAIIRRAVAAGDECHSRTGAANAALVSGIGGLEGAMAATLMAVPAFVLPLLMAGAAAALRHHSSAVEAIGGNGVEFGLRRRGERDWRQMPAQAPAGATADPPGIALPAIGDSVVVDYCGLGGQVDTPQLRQALLDPSSGIIDHARIVATGMRPAFNLAILDTAGERGLIGRGTYRPPAELFM